MKTFNKTFTVLEGSKGVRLDKFVSTQIEYLSRVKIHNLIQNGAIVIDGIIKKPSFHLKTGQVIHISLKEEKNKLKPFRSAVKIIYEDSDIIVVDKPSNLTVHPPHLNSQNTLVNILLYMKKNLSNLDTLRPGVVHRLDKETSGVMILAKNNSSQESLVSQFKERKIKKEYIAIVWGKVKKDKISVKLPMARDSRNRLKMKVSFHNSKAAHSEITVLKRFEDSTYLSIKPITGRMHQIRVHLNFLEFPIVGDKKYGVKDACKELLLHSKKINFCHPKSNKKLTFISLPPKRFTEFTDKQVSFPN